VLSTLQATKASRTSGEAPAMLSLENDMGYFNGGGFVGWFMGAVRIGFQCVRKA
jgi:hypothetical protein